MSPGSRSSPWLAATCLAFVLAACGGGGGGGGDTGGGGGGGGGGGSRLYIGYYAEDPVNNPEDPTVGAVMFRVPDGNGAFAGQMPFSYVGCSAGVDTGTISGTRNAAALTGSWSGVMDGSVSVGGSLSATHDATEDSFTGSFTNTAGKVQVSVGPCNYHVAASGSFKVWGDAAQQPASFTITATSTTTPTFLWSSLGAGTLYTVRVFGYACLLADPGSTACFLGESVPTTGLSAAYPAVFPGATALTLGTEYLVVVTGQDATTGAFTGFTSTRFTPGTVGGGTDPDPDPDPGPGPGSGEGTLTITGASLGETFDPHGSPNGRADIAEIGPTCNVNTGLCTSGLAITWSEVDVLAARSRSVGIMLTSTTSVAPGHPPGTNVTHIFGVYSQTQPVADQANYVEQCGEPAIILPHCPAVALLGVNWDLATRTVTFTDVVLPGQAPTTGTVTLNGTLTY